VAILGDGPKSRHMHDENDGYRKSVIFLQPNTVKASHLNVSNQLTINVAIANRSRVSCAHKLNPIQSIYLSAVNINRIELKELRSTLKVPGEVQHF